MDPAVTAVALVALFVVLAFGWRTVVQVRRHGDTGWRFRAEGVERVVGPMLVVGFGLLAAGPLWAVLGGGGSEVPGAVAALGAGARWTVASVVGAGLVLGAIALTVVAQVQMGESWRIGVQAGERTDLVTSGLFGRMRNPIFTGMLAFSAGVAAMVPNAATIVGAVLAWASIQVQVRLVEEPNLREIHGDPYRRWTATTGRFLPGIGHR